MIRVVHPGSGFFTHPGSRIQGLKRHRILDPRSRIRNTGSVKGCSPQAGEDTQVRNAARVAAVWLDEYIRYFHETVSGSEYINTGDISKRKGMGPSVPVLN